jgi:hypothetical protein
MPACGLRRPGSLWRNVRSRAAVVRSKQDLLAEDDRLNVYAGEIEVRPPGAPTTAPVRGPDGEFRTLQTAQSDVFRADRWREIPMATSDAAAIRITAAP